MRFSLLALSLPLLLACSNRESGSEGEWPEPTWPELRSGLPHDANPTLDANEQSDFARDNRLFALDLYHRLRQDPSFEGKNLLFSPSSIRTALAMLYAGAVGPGGDQMATALHYSLPGERQHVAFNWLDDELASRKVEADVDPDTQEVLKGEVLVLPANGVWADQGIRGKIEPAYIDLLSVHYDAPLRLADFVGNKEGERVKLNQWVEARTHGLIPELLPPNSLPENLTMALINAVYLKAPWSAPFDGPTYPSPFLGAEALEVPTMSHTGADVHHGVGDDFEIVAIPLRGHDLQLIALMPTGDFASFEASLDEPKLAATLDSLELDYVMLEFPKLDVAADFELSDALQALGITLAYEGGVFEGIGGVDKLASVRHQAVIKADEDGVEAAAATVALLDDEVGGGSDVLVKIDRAFFLMIRDEPTDTLLFFGRVLDPRG